MKLTGDKFSWPNIISYLRIVLIPLFIYLLTIKTASAWMWALIIFAIASLTDFIDGWLARKLKQESEFGKFIDPLADKFLVISALIAIIAIDPYFELFDSWMILIIVARDVLITFMRWLAIKRGKPLRTSRFGKFKTAFQMMSIVIIIMIYMVKKLGILETHPSVPYWIMFAVTIMTALSGVRYIVTNWQLFFPQKKVKED
ncbi:MAG TPA: CDP-diacylglycerol--glycerol-3-phosphate 3-phosphatidyltransferase [Spirochaetota bacterium]|nr:CDP-diacylglycerol--glycerol-3-phosphate 3-phosphatidyltransferase [Spirochaetota bacterium]OQB00321.1 MAG: CDP-diacylglycerol--glycerol-3-phosphate 3-phosphatidyltransferase [Spirochaetes bacterium ADurb.Bin218]HOK02321.1 CDP-diacylglycerol--glycerol-3-phosphate 3-phosphatidyltransferase [Spirochaetota bacterium]HOK92541.1 CDP-diacylglycerol--glycerol-3-phosphate 3-phosphatidyltransferase [Spirochaetota bacterium]HON15281.1 CDP-diacylglycerol--glycerol-3-phosphate 3-phosphatidyltransferase 